MSYAKDIQLNWNGYLDIDFTVTFYDGSVKVFYFVQQSEGYTTYILYDAELSLRGKAMDHSGWDNPLEVFTVTYKTKPETVIAKCLAILRDKYID
jgi:hypothetical protein